MATRIGIDTGGTFTDVVRADRNGLSVHKVRSTPEDPSRAVLAGLAAVRSGDEEPVDLVHGTTVGLNAVLTGKLARTVFVTNHGCEDLIEIGRQQRVDLYALAPSRPAPPVPRKLRVGVACRRDANGEVVQHLTRQEVARICKQVRALRPEAIAIGLLHSPRNLADEHALAKALANAVKDVPITCSADLLPAFGEYERFTAAILNASIAPAVGRYTGRVEQGIGNGTLRLLRSSLGILPPAEARLYPARAMFSGPAGGVLAAGQLIDRLGLQRCAAFDMGGTSADVCLVERDVTMATDGCIAGLPLPCRSVPVHTVAAGGGSIAFADAGGSLRVGPESAGADPGPACYGAGGDATVTDAHVALGHLGADTLLDGGFPIDVDASVAAIERLAKRLGMRTRAAAEGILTVADATMARAVLVITAERAIDPAHVPLVAYGGAGGLHAATLMRTLGMPSAIVPAHPGAFSAVGIALAGDATERACACNDTLDAKTLRKLLAVGKKLLASAEDELRAAPAAGRSPRLRRRMEATVRYRGQGAGLAIPLRAQLAEMFRAEHHRRYGFDMDAPIEVVQIRARCERPTHVLPPSQAAPAESTRSHRKRPIGGPPITVYRRASGAPASISGPAIVEEATGTTLIPRGCAATFSQFGLRMAAV